MIAHDTPGINFKPFICLAMFYTIEQNFAVRYSCENIDPVNHRKRYEVGIFLVQEFVVAAHGFAR